MVPSGVALTSSLSRAPAGARTPGPTTSPRSWRRKARSRPSRTSTARRTGPGRCAARPTAGPPARGAATVATAVKRSTGTWRARKTGARVLGPARQAQRPALGPGVGHGEERPLPAERQRAVEAVGEAGGRRSPGGPQWCRACDARALPVRDRRPALGADVDAVEQRGSGVEHVVAAVGVVQEEEPGWPEVDGRAVARALPRRIAGEQRIGRVLRVGPEQRRCPRGALGIAARRPAAMPAGVEEQIGAAAAHERGAFGDALLPARVRRDELVCVADRAQPALAEAHRIDPLADAETLEQQPAAGVGIGEGIDVDDASGSAEHRPAVTPRPCGPRGGGEADARPPAAAARRVERHGARARVPEVAGRPARSAREHGAHLAPADERSVDRKTGKMGAHDALVALA